MQYHKPVYFSKIFFIDGGRSLGLRGFSTAFECVSGRGDLCKAVLKPRSPHGRPRKRLTVPPWPCYDQPVMAQSSSKPNVIVCLCDQLRAFEVGCYGNSVVKTPNIDRLAREGVRFEVACSNNPVCTPGRSILLTGQYSRTCQGMLVNCGEPVPERVQLPGPTLAEAFKEAGYDTALIGKWHIAPEPATVGFDFAVYPHHAHRYTGQTFHRSDGEDVVIDGFTTDYEIEELGKNIRQHRDPESSSGPFFLFHNISQPHMPLDDAPERIKTMYSRDEVPLRPNVFEDGRMAHDENWFRIYLYDYLYYQKHLPYTEAPLKDGFDLRDLTALYYGTTTWTDDQVGALVGLLERNGILDNTIIVFTSDHGDNLGSHQFFNKDLLYEESIRIPMIFHWPAALRRRKVSWQVGSLVDVMPTVLSLAGVRTPQTCQGTDLAQVVRGEADVLGENAAFIETSAGPVGIRTLTHLYGIQKQRTPDRRTTDVTDDDYMLFDVPADPYEFENLAKTGKNREAADRLRDRLLKWDLDTPWKGAP